MKKGKTTEPKKRGNPEKATKADLTMISGRIEMEKLYDLAPELGKKELTLNALIKQYKVDIVLKASSNGKSIEGAAQKAKVAKSTAQGWIDKVKSPKIKP